MADEEKQIEQDGQTGQEKPVGQNGAEETPAEYGSLEALRRAKNMEERTAKFKELCDNLIEYMKSRPPLKTGPGTCKEYLIDLSREVPNPVAMLKQERTDVAVFTEGNLSLIVGAAKSRKTTLMVALAAALLGKPQLGLKAVRDDFKVVYLDTEQGPNFAYMTARKVHQLMGWSDKENNPRFLYYEVCEAELERRLRTVEEVMLTDSPNFLFLDGIVDICKDFNNNEGCGNLVGKLMRLARENNCHICAALHFNKDGMTERGHLGAMYKQKCETTINVEIFDGYSKALPAENGCRGLPFEPFCFTMEGNNGLPVAYEVAGAPPKTTSQKSGKKSAGDKMRDCVEAILRNAQGNRLRHGELVAEILQSYKKANGAPVSRKYAEDTVTRLKSDGFIAKLNNGDYMLEVHVKKNNLQTEIVTEE